MENKLLDVKHYSEKQLCACVCVRLYAELEKRKSFHHISAGELLDSHNSSSFLSYSSTSVTTFPYSSPFTLFHIQFILQFLSIHLFPLCPLLHLCLHQGGQEVVLRL